MEHRLRLRNRYENWRHGFDCRRAVDLATDYVEGTLSAKDHALYQRHLAHCPPCRDYMAQMRLTIETAGRLEPMQLPPDVLTGLLEAHRRFRSGN